MKHVAALVMMALLAACSEPPPATVITVSEFLADESLRADHIGKCRENPGELGETPNCRNAEEAEGKARLERMNRALGDSAMYTVFGFLDRQFTTPLQNFISSGTSGISAWVTGPLTAALTLYVILYGFLILRGSVQEPIMEFAFRAIKLAIILMLVRNAGEYQTYVTNVFFEILPREVSEALNTGGAPSATTFDSLLDKGQKSANDIWAQASWPVDPLTGFAGLVVVFVTFVVASIGYVVSLYARVALAIVLAIGPIFIALAMFQSTRRFTEAWIGQLANFVILQVLVVAVGSLLVTSFATMFTTVEAYSDVLMRPIAVGAIGLASLYVFYQLPGIASALASGGASLTYGYTAARDGHNNTVVRAIGWSWRRLTGRGA